jgi:hypothetical protein
MQLGAAVDAALAALLLLTTQFDTVVTFQYIYVVYVLVHISVIFRSLIRTLFVPRYVFDHCLWCYRLVVD